MASAQAAPSAKEMRTQVLFPDDGMPRGGKRKAKLKTADFRRIERKAFEEFGDQSRGIREATRATNTDGGQKSGKGQGIESGGSPGDFSTVGHSASDPCLSRHFLQKGFGLGNRPGIWMGCDNAVGPGTYDVHEVGAIKWLKDEGSSHPAQCCVTNYKSPKLISFGKPKPWTGPGGPSLSQSPGPGHYGMPDFWDANWQKYPSAGKSFVRKLPPPGESKFGGLARQELRNAKGDANFLH